MIIEIKVANYRSINEEQTLSFVADLATRHSDNLIKRPGYRLLKSVGLFGANASGKSNFVKAIGAMRDFVINSATKMNDGDLIAAVEPYRLDPGAREQPSRFQIKFLTNDTVYTYGFTAHHGYVQEEKLSAMPETSKKVTFWLRRFYNTDHGAYGCQCSDSSKVFADLTLSWTRPNALALSVGAQRNIKELLPAYRFIRDNISTSDMSDATGVLFRYAARRCKDDEQLRHKVSSLLRDADTGVEGIEVDKPSFADILAVSSDVPHGQGTLTMAANRYDNPGFTLPITATRHDIFGKSIDFDFNLYESRGTNRFFVAAVLLLDSLNSGAFQAIDELDASMHPLLTRKLLELFQSPEANPNGAQLLFTTHDPSLLDQELFRRDQIWLAEKRGGASTFFSLADIEPHIRSTESFLRNYLAGRYGGTPQLGGVLQSLDLGAAKSVSNAK